MTVPKAVALGFFRALFGGGALGPPVDSCIHWHSLAQAALLALSLGSALQHGKVSPKPICTAPRS